MRLRGGHRDGRLGRRVVGQVGAGRVHRAAGRGSSASDARTWTASSPNRWISSGSSAARLDTALEPGPALGPDELRRLGQRAPGDTHVDGGVQELGDRAVESAARKVRWCGTTRSAGTGTASRRTVPLAVVRWPMPSQSSTTVSPGASRGTYATCSVVVLGAGEHRDPVGEQRAGASSA